MSDAELLAKSRRGCKCEGSTPCNYHQGFEDGLDAAESKLAAAEADRDRYLKFWHGYHSHGEYVSVRSHDCPLCFPADRALSTTPEEPE